MIIPNDTDLKALLEPYTHRKGALLEALHAVQVQYGYVDTSFVPIIAISFNLSEAEVHGVVSFYHDFRAAPAGKHIIKICQAEACKSVGSDALTEHAVKALGIALNTTSSCGSFTLEPVYCLGNCALAPAVMVDGAVHGRVNTERLDALLNKGDSK